MIKKVLAIGLLFVSFNLAFGQEESERGSFLGLGFSYGLNIPVGELADRFGTNFHAGLSLDWFDGNKNASYGIEGYILFGDNVKEDVLASMRLDNNAILGFDGSYADVFLRERGNYLGLYYRKIVAPLKQNKRSGLAVGVGVGALQHKIRIQVDTRNAPQLEGEYQKGYDRNTFGPALKQMLSYTHLGKSKSVNFALSLEITEGFTKSMRAANFDTQEKPDSGRLDILIGLDFKWFIPLKDNRVPEEIFY